MKKTICGFLAIFFLLSGINFSIVSNASAVSDIPEQEQLENFLVWVYAFAGQYDYQDSQSNNLFGSLANLLSIAHSSIWGIEYPGIDFDTRHVGYGNSTYDPLSKFNSNCTRTNKAGLDWLGKFIFNIPDQDWEADKQNEFASGFYYEHGDYYWAGEGEIGFAYDPDITIVDCTRAPNDYYKVVYYVEDQTMGDGYAYALLQLKDYEGKRYWSLYHNSNNEEEVFDDLVTEEYRESRYGYGESYLTLPNGRRIVSRSDDKLYDQYSGKVIATDVYGSFFSNGTYLYYNKYTYSSGKRSIHRLDLRTNEDITLLEGKWAGTSYVAPELTGVYKDKYIYYNKLDNYGYLYKGEPYAEIIDSSLGIFDIETGNEVNELQCGGYLWVLGDHICTIPYHGDASPEPLCIYDPDGSNRIEITDEIYDGINSPFKIYGTKLIYAAYNVDMGWSKPRFQIREYDIQNGTTTNLTDYYNNTYPNVIYPDAVYYDYAVFKDTTGKRTAIYYERQNTNISVFLNGNEIIFDQPPVIQNGRTLVPLRAIFEALGATVDWDGNTRTVTATKGDTIVKITIGDNKLYKNGKVIELDVPAQIINDRTLVPVRAVSEAFDCKVDWDGETKTVIITTNEFKTFISAISQSSTVYNNDLALICAHQCKKIGDIYDSEDTDNIKNEYKKLGISEDNIYTLADAKESYYFSLACMQDVMVYGEKYNVLFITARGTCTTEEGVKDATSRATKEFWDYSAYDDSYLFYNKIQDAIEGDFLSAHPFLKENNLKVVITGYSLGGSAANLVAAAFDNCLTAPKAWWSDLTTKDDIYCYTFGGIGSIKCSYDARTDIGFENIHNIYNFYDSYGPNGSWIVMKKEAEMVMDLEGSAYKIHSNDRNATLNQRFGHIELFGDNDYWEEKYADDKPFSINQHLMSTYIDALEDHNSSDFRHSCGEEIFYEPTTSIG